MFLRDERMRFALELFREEVQGEIDRPDMMANSPRLDQWRAASRRRTPQFLSLLSEPAPVRSRKRAHNLAKAPTGIIALKRVAD